jgi:hypothetical protein
MLREVRKPYGYAGIGHETIGSDILAVAQILRMPDQILGPALANQLAHVRADQWYPIRFLLDVMEKMDQSVGKYGLLQMGRTLFDLSHRERLLQIATSARDVIYGINGMYHHANRGSGIGGWSVIRFEAGEAELEKTTPHHCVMEEGILSGALKAVGCPTTISQRRCFRKGADRCVFVVRSSIKDERWGIVG